MRFKSYLQQSFLLCSAASFILNMNSIQAAEVVADQPVAIYNVKGFRPATGMLFDKADVLINQNLSKKVPCPPVLYSKKKVINPKAKTELSICKEWTKDLIYNQGDLGSCTANSSMQAVRMLSVINSDKPHVMVSDSRGRLVRNPDMLDPSRLYQYYNTRFYETKMAGLSFDPTDDTGASIIGSVLALDKFGCCPESVIVNEETINLVDLKGHYKFTGWKYDVSKFSIQPEPDCYQAAYDRSIDGLNDGTPFTQVGKILNPYARISVALQYRDLSSAYRNKSASYLNTPEEQMHFRDGVLTALSNNHPVLIGLALDNTFMHDQKGFIPTPVLKDFKPIGGHALLVDAYGPLNPNNPGKNYYRIKNSWGEDWGDAGSGYLEESYLNNVNFFGVEAHEVWLNPAVK